MGPLRHINLHAILRQTTTDRNTTGHRQDSLTIAVRQCPAYALKHDGAELVTCASATALSPTPPPELGVRQNQVYRRQQRDQVAGAAGAAPKRATTPGSAPTEWKCHRGRIKKDQPRLEDYKPRGSKTRSPLPFPRHTLRAARVSQHTLAAWNVSSFLDNMRSNQLERRTALVARETARYKVDIGALSETQFPEQGQLEELGAGYTFFWSDRPKAE
ncbi:unnamed protein product [Schistocephalus solidus]|uniref:Uncharacterized protein n=1 Tax=Schistocephalus solidus TaxID=70667 RepID=A0A183TFH1_SCHSO|nr:unnamed protein product [Schistocephalus solidus]